MSRLNENKSFSEYDLTLNPKCKDGYDACINWANDKGSPALVLYGQTGVGKTHLAIAAAWSKIGMGNPTLYYSATELIRDLQNAVNNGTLDSLIQTIKSSQNLVLDDLGRE